MTTWVHLSAYLLFGIKFSPFKLYNAGSTVFQTASVKYNLFEVTRKRNTLFSLKKGKNEKRMISTLFVSAAQNAELTSMKPMGLTSNFI